MRFKQIIENSTTAGSVATVAQPMMTQTRESVDVKGLKPVQQVMKGTKKKGPYANSIVESKVTEDDLAEQDLIIIPGQGRLKRTGFVKHDLDQGEHEGHTLKNSLHTIARAASDLDKRLSVQSEFPEWVSEKIGAAKGMMVSVMDYLISSQEMQHDRDNMEEGSGESYIIVRTDAEGKKDVFAGNFDTYERAQKELDGLLAHPLHTKYKQKFEIKRKGGEQGVAEGSEDKIKQLKADHATAVHWSKNETSPQKREAARQKAEKIKAHLEKQYKQGVVESQHSESCPHCGGEMVSEELMNEKKDACYYKVKSRYKVWPSAYASGALVKCRKKGADSWGNGGKKNESSILEGINRVDESLHDWFNKEKWVRMDTKGNIKGPCAKEPGEGKPKCLPQAKAHSLGKKGRASAAARKRREDPNPDRSGKAINVNTKKEK